MLALIPFTVTSVASVLLLVQLSFISAIASSNYAPIYNTDYFFLHGATVPKGQGPLVFKVSRSHSDTPLSVGLLWTSDQLVAEASAYEHTTLTTDIHATGGIGTRSPSMRAAAEARLRPRGTGIGYTVAISSVWPFINTDWLVFSSFLILC
jgi:hypothetical protein